MKITIKSLILVILFAFIFQLLLLVFGIHILYLTTIFSLLTFLIIPGLLFLFIFQATRQSFGETIIYSVGVSIFLLEIIGLSVNFLFTSLQIPQPLSLYPLIIGIGSTVLLLSSLAWIWDDNHAITITIPKINAFEVLLVLIVTALPFVAVFGAISINNGGSNFITLSLLGMIAVIIFLLTAGRKRITPSFYPYTIFFIALSLLFTTSLRSWYVSGHDILREYYIYSLTVKNLQWNINIFRDAYNACLSITILPVMLEQLLHIPGIYIFKVIFQIVFSLCPVLLYYVFKKYTTSILSFLAVCIFMTFPTFFNDMPMLTRQEIGFLFFGLALHSLLTSTLSKRTRKWLFIIFTFSIILSHYSTNYILIILTLSVYLFSFVSENKFIKQLTGRFKRVNGQFVHIPFLSIELIIIMFIGTYIWNFQITKTGSNLNKTINESIQNMINRTFNDSRSSDVGYSLFFPKKLDPQKELDEYINDSVKRAKELKETGYYSKEEYEKYKIKPQKQLLLPRTSLGHYFTSLYIPVFKVQSTIRQLAAGLMQILVVIGITILVFKKHKKQIDTQFLFLCVGGISLLFMTIILPSISVEYGLLRMFQQMLFVFSFPIILAIYAIPFFAGSTIRHVFTALIVISFFLTLTGFFSHLTGDYYPQLPLDNAGLYYDAYYVHKEDVLAVAWLKENNNKYTPVQSDLSGTLKLQALGNIFATSEIFPQIILKNAFVFYTGNPRAIVSIDKNVLIYSSSESFSQDYKNLIYNNGKDKIYK